MRIYSIKSQWLEFALLAALAFMVAPACQNPKVTDHEQFRRSISDNPRTLDPSLADDEVSVELISQIYEAPLQYRYDSNDLTQLEPLILTEMPRVSDQGLSVTLTLRSPLRFQNDPCFPNGVGREVSSRDLKLAILRLLDPATHSGGFWTFHQRLQGDEEFSEAVQNTPFRDWASRLALYEEHPLRGLETPDDKTLTFKLQRPFPQLNFILAMTVTAPIAQEALIQYGEDFGKHPVGTGPYLLSSWHRNSRLTLQAAPTYWGAPVHFKKVIYEIMVESQPQWLKFMNGELALLGIPKDNYDQAITKERQLTESLKARGIQLLIRTLPTLWYVGFNMKDPVVGKDSKLREAIMLAYDADERIRVLTNGRAVRANSVIPPGIPGHEETIEAVPARDLKRAKALLQSSRYRREDNPLPLRYDLRGNSTTQRQWGEFFKRDMETLGVKVEVNLNSFTEYIEKEKSGRLQIFMGGWIADYPDPENFLQLLYGPNAAPGPNATNYDNSQFNKLYKKLALTFDLNQRMKIIKQLLEIVSEDKPWHIDFYSTQYVLLQPWLKNYRQHPFCYNYIKYLSN